MSVGSSIEITRKAAINALKAVNLNSLTNEQLGELLEVLNPFYKYHFVDSAPVVTCVGEPHGS